MNRIERLKISFRSNKIDLEWDKTECGKLNKICVFLTEASKKAEHYSKIESKLKLDALD